MNAHDPHPAVPWYRRRSVIDAAVATVVAVFTATGAFGTNDFFGPTLVGIDGSFPPLSLAVPLAVGLGLLAGWRRRLPVIFLVGSLLANALVSAHTAVAVALYTLAERTTSWPKAAAGALVAITVVAIPIWRFAGADGTIPISLASCVAPTLLGLYVGTRNQLVEWIRERAGQIERERDQHIARARSEERAQIARDMHDVVTHRVSLMVLHATALEASQGRDATALARQIGSIGRETLDELRSLVAVLRRDDSEVPLAPQKGLADLDALVEESRRLGTPVTLEMVNQTGARPPLLVEHTAYRVVQEALTNVHKHAPDARTRVRTEQTPQLLRVSISNSRGQSATGSALPTSGHGLLGLAERVRLVDGELTAGSTPHGGFELVAEVPLAHGTGDDLSD